MTAQTAALNHAIAPLVIQIAVQTAFLDALNNRVQVLVDDLHLSRTRTRNRIIKATENGLRPLFSEIDGRIGQLSPFSRTL